MKLKLRLILFQITLSICLIQQTFSIQNLKTNKFAHKHHLKKSHLRGDDKDVKPTPLPSEMPDYKFSGKNDFQEFEEILKDHHLTKGEIKALFRLTDLNKDSKVDNEEWFHFQKIFVQPFETCDTDKDYYLNKDELGKCLEGPSLNGTQLKEKDAAEVLNNLDRTKLQKINFADYIFLRKVNLAWKECAADGGLTKLKIGCALEITAPGRTLDLPEGKQVIDLALIFRNGQSTDKQTSINILEYINIAHIFYYFTEFEIPFQDGKIYQREVIKALDNQILPTSLNPDIVNQMYDGFEFLSFSGWAAMNYAHKLFESYSKETKGLLSKTEFGELLKWTGFNQLLIKIIDAFFMPTQQEIEDASALRSKKIISEKDFIVNFLQIKQKLKLKEDGDKNDPYKDENKNIIFKIFDIFDDGKLRYSNFVQFLKFGWCFQMYDQDKNNYLDDFELLKGPKLYESILPLRQNEIIQLTKLTDFVESRRGYIINIKQFYSWFTKHQILEQISVKGIGQMVPKAKLSSAFLRLGLRLAKYTISQSQEGTDFQLKQPVYNFKNAYLMALEDDIVANKLKISQKIQNKKDEDKK